MNRCPFHGEDITMILRHEDVRRAAKDRVTFSSDAPFRVPIPSEESVRGMRQLCCERVERIHLLGATGRVEHQAAFDRAHGHDTPPSRGLCHDRHGTNEYQRPQAFRLLA